MVGTAGLYVLCLELGMGNYPVIRQLLGRQSLRCASGAEQDLGASRKMVRISSPADLGLVSLDTHSQPTRLSGQPHR